jgi:hypothetical protein
MEKLIKDGKVAVAVSKGFGVGWSTWSDANPMDKRFNELILEGNLKEAEALAKDLGYYSGGLEDCEIEWVEIGTRFEIKEYDGNESLRIYVDIPYYTA